MSFEEVVLTRVRYEIPFHGCKNIRALSTVGISIEQIVGGARIYVPCGG